MITLIRLLIKLSHWISLYSQKLLLRLDVIIDYLVEYQIEKDSKKPIDRRVL
jgi:hypothetical protein